MTTDQIAAPTSTPTASTFDSLDPATGAVVASFPVDDAARVAEVVAAARPAAAWWADLGFDGRKARLLAWRRILAARLPELADLMHRENGKTYDDAVGEAALAVEHLDWAAKHAGKVLADHAVRPGLLAMNMRARVQNRPFGVVGVIGPWNYPVHTPMGSISYALAAGNAVVFKPSEYTPAVGAWLVDTFAEVVPEHPVFSLVTGFGATGDALCRSGVGKLAFTGSTATGKKVMAACADTLTPVVIECGGKDALIVAADADVEAAADAAVWGGFTNAGQTCIGIERVYAVEAVHDAFVAAVTRRASRLRAGRDYGPITMPGQVDVIRRHLAAAEADGGRAVVSGAVDGFLVQPSVFVDVPEWSAAVQEETFGPTLTIARVRDEDEAVERANGTDFGLGAAVFSRHDGERIANRLRTGMVSVNSVLSYAMVPELPFGGVGASGFGRIHGREGLREFVWQRSVASQRMKAPLTVTSYERPRWAVPTLVRMVRTVWGRGAAGTKGSRS
ncbi:aldehyde dehydrogenase family protein [Jatrophihabitans sp. YIM 134969]